MNENLGCEIDRKNLISWLKVEIGRNNFIFCLLFCLLLGCLTANFGVLLKVKTHSPDVNHCVTNL